MTKLSGPNRSHSSFGAPAPLRLHARKHAAGEVALPVLATVPGAKGDRDRNVGAGRRKADDERHQPREPSASPLDHSDAVRGPLAPHVVHGLQRRGQGIPSLAENAPVKGRAVAGR
jgi:hypothetical protein